MQCSRRRHHIWAWRLSAACSLEAGCWSKFCGLPYTSTSAPRPSAPSGTACSTMQTMAPVLDFETGKTVIQFSDRFDAEPYHSLCGRTRRWAAAAGYAYHAETERGLPTYSVYWEKVRMGLEALERGVEWALWVDDDATINRADTRTDDFLARFPDRSLLIGVQAELEDHGITATHYHNWGVWIVRNDAWSRALLRQMLQPDGRCADLHRAAKLGNPEQDCFARFVHESTATLVYPFDALGRNLDTLALNRSTLAKLGEPRNMDFNCICQTGQTCSPWFLHFMQATNRHSSSPLTSTFTLSFLNSHPRRPPSRMPCSLYGHTYLLRRRPPSRRRASCPRGSTG